MSFEDFDYTSPHNGKRRRVDVNVKVSVPKYYHHYRRRHRDDRRRNRNNKKYRKSPKWKKNKLHDGKNKPCQKKKSCQKKHKTSVGRVIEKGKILIYGFQKRYGIFT